MIAKGFEVTYGSETRISPPKKWLSKHRSTYEDDASSRRREPTSDEDDEE